MAHTTRPLFNLRLLGQPSLKDENGVTPPSLGWGKPLALLAFLAIRGEARRDEIVDLLWRDVDEAKARNAFRQALHRLRSALGEELVPQDREVLRLNASDAIRIDSREFERAVSAGNHDEAIETYQGDFLEGVELAEPAFDLWADQERTRFRAQFRGSLEAAIANAQSAGRWNSAIAHSRRLTELLPLDEQAARIAATALISAGRRNEARDLLLRFGARLHAELGVAATPELQTLIARLEKTGDVTPQRALSGDRAVLPFTGREPELSQLMSLWRGVEDDSGAIALVEGDPGIGKSRLVYELVAHARSLGGATILSARERPASSGVPFALLAEALRPLVRAPGVVGASRHLLAEASRLLPELRDTVELPPITSIEDEAARVRFFEGIAALVDAAAYEQPILLVLEDLHLVGPSTLDLLSYLTGRLAGSAVMFVLTLRTTDAPASVASRLRSLVASRAERSKNISLGPLDRDASLRMLQSVAASARLTDAARSRIVDRAEGVPARHAELLRRVLAGDDIAQLPVAIRALIDERLRSLSSSHRRAFLALALLGRPATPRLLADVAHLSESAVPETVQALEEAALISRRDGVIEADALAADLALSAAGSDSRAFLAGWIGDALAADPTTPPAELAKFHALAGRARDACAASRRAAFAALAIGGWSEAVHHAQVARSFADSPEQLREIETLLSALGAGNPKLAAASPPADAITTAAESRTGPTEPARVPVRAPSRWELWFPNWRALFGAAVATLLVSTFVMWRAPRSVLPAIASTDTLVLAEPAPSTSLRLVAGDLLTGFTVSSAVPKTPTVPAWADSVTRPWSGVIPGPRGQRVALTRLESGGVSVFVISADRRDTVRLTKPDGESRPVGWSPDGRWVLVLTARRLSNDRRDFDLLAMRADGTGAIAIDTAAQRSVMEAKWSPDGTRIAWVVQMDSSRQQEIFISQADGSDMENVTNHPADDYHLDWSGDGELLGFTSRRDGNAELYAVGIRERRLWRLTRDPAQDDWGRFSTDGRLIAFESTRGGEARVYVMPALGGDPRAVAADLPLSIVSWSGGRSRYADRIRVTPAGVLRPGETTDLRISALDQFGDSIQSPAVRMHALDTALVTVHSDTIADGVRVTGRRSGLARIVADVGRWRIDTAFVRIGTDAVAFTDGVPGTSFWHPLGAKLVEFAGRAAILSTSEDVEAGLLSRASIPLIPGATLRATFVTPRGANEARGVSIALVAPDDAEAVDSIAPQFLRYASATWDDDAGRFIFSAGREVTSESATQTSIDSMTLELRIEPDSTVSFWVDSQRRWRSTLRAVTSRSDPKVQLWLGARGGAVSITHARAGLAGIGTP